MTDSNDSALCGSKGNLRNILELICNEPVEFNLRLDRGLNEDVREWLTSSGGLSEFLKFRQPPYVVWYIIIIILKGTLLKLAYKE